MTLKRLNSMREIMKLKLYRKVKWKKLKIQHGNMMHHLKWKDYRFFSNNNKNNWNRNYSTERIGYKRWKKLIKPLIANWKCTNLKLINKREDKFRIE